MLCARRWIQGSQQETLAGAGLRWVRCPLLLMLCALMPVRCGARSSLCVCWINAKPLGGIWFSGDVHRMNQPELSPSPALARGFNFVRRCREDGMRERILTARNSICALLPKGATSSRERSDGSLAYQEMRWNVKSPVKRFKILAHLRSILSI